jgi:hypothetical protein
MVVGRDVEIGDIPELLDQTVMGIFFGKIVTTPTLISYMVENWLKVISYRPSFHTLEREWIYFKFHSKKTRYFSKRSWGWGS